MGTTVRWLPARLTSIPGLLGGAALWRDEREGWKERERGGEGGGYLE